MNGKFKTFAVGVAAGLVSVSLPAYAQETPRDIIDRVDRIMRGDSSRGTATMEVVTEHWNRSITMDVWSLGTEYSLVRVTQPAREAAPGRSKRNKTSGTTCRKSIAPSRFPHP